jgi:hypothetical protein
MVSLPSISEDRTYDSEADFEEQESDRRRAEKAALLAAAIFCAWTFQRTNFQELQYCTSRSEEGNSSTGTVKKDIKSLLLGCERSFFSRIFG